jgi:hypothetical protein
MLGATLGARLGIWDGATLGAKFGACEGTRVLPGAAEGATVGSYCVKTLRTVVEGTYKLISPL